MALRNVRLGEAHAVAPIGQPSLVAQLLGASQVLDGDCLLALLMGELAQPQIQVGRAPDRRLTLRAHQSHGLGIASNSLMETTLHYSDIGQARGDTGGEMQAADLLKSNHGIGKRAIGRLQIAAGPLGEAEECRGRPAPEIVCFWYEIERPLAIGYRGRELTTRLGKVGPGSGDRRREIPKLRVVYDDHRGCIVGPSPAQHGVQPLLRIPQPGLGGLEITSIQQRPGIRNIEHGPVANQRVGQRPRPAKPRDGLETPVHCRPDLFDQARRAREIRGGQRMVNRLGRQTIGGAPGARPLMQDRNVGWLLLEHMSSQHVGKELVVAKPVALVVERDEKQVGALQGIQQHHAIALAGDGITQRAAQPIKDGCLEQEAAHPFGLTLEHLFDQIIHDVAVVAGERLYEPGNIRPPTQ